MDTKFYREIDTNMTTLSFETQVLVLKTATRGLFFSFQQIGTACVTGMYNLG